MSEPFYTKRRLTAVKELLRENPNLEHGSVADLELRTFLIDLAENIARQHDGDREAALHYVIRNMGVVVQKYAKAAYRPHGYTNPFAKVKKPSPPAPKWTFPVVNQPPVYSSGHFEANFRQYSALKMFDYTVGKTNGWPAAKRQRFLSDFMELELPSKVEATFGDEYGGPLTTTRLRKVANVIASNASNFLKNDAIRYRVAIEEWEDDLAFLKEKYYEHAGLKFHPWPDPR